MTIGKTFLEEFKQEAASTRKLLERVPLDKASWKPHEKSMELGRLASHVAETSLWIWNTIENDVFDLAVQPYEPIVPKTTEELLKFFDENNAKTESVLSKCSDEEMMKTWTMKNGEQVYISMPKAPVIRSFCLNHMIHHRGQLDVYLRLLDVQLPQIYGPTADEK
jgi:uncharacterized damage-inducible protein DinB